MTSLSTHVLDTARGAPAVGMPVSLRRVGGPDDAGDVAAGRTDADGRLRLADELAPGAYRLTFVTGDYLGAGAFYPRVTVEFTVDAGEPHYHVPLLLSPFGYSTYRGS